MHDRLRERCFHEWQRCRARGLRVPAGPERAAWFDKATRWAVLYDRITDHMNGKHIGTRRMTAARFARLAGLMQSEVA